MIDPIVGDIGNDPKLRYVVEQLNRRFRDLNRLQTETDSSIDDAVTDVNALCDENGDIITDEEGNIVTSG